MLHPKTEDRRRGTKLVVGLPSSVLLTIAAGKLPTEMEFESMFNFQSIGNGQVASVGEFVVLKDEADPVARELRRRKIQVTALHSHELDVSPDVYYIHSWATGDPIKLAHDLRAALNRTNSDFE